MIYIDSKPNPSGAYPNPKNQPFPGCVPLTDEQAAVFFEYNGFVFLTEDGEITPNLTAWESWKATAPSTPDPDEPESPDGGPSVWDELDAAYQEGVNAAYDE